ncbi:hypothetical protein ACIA78_37660 [Streptomyces xanthochromogenes]|uniref:hypothetical protein n=1 Tax=Streptomyces xanthochromogenes TaxID=67384 RepID=UPI003799FE0C
MMMMPAALRGALVGAVLLLGATCATAHAAAGDPPPPAQPQAQPQPPSADPPTSGIDCKKFHELEEQAKEQLTSPAAQVPSDQNALLSNPQAQMMCAQTTPSEITQMPSVAQRPPGQSFPTQPPATPATT